MALGDLNTPTWRIDVYRVKSDTKYGGYITDLSTFYTSSLSITRKRNYPDEVTFTLDLQQLQNRADALNIDSRSLLQPYEHKVKLYRNNQFMVQAIVTKVNVNLNNQGKNTVEVSCVDILGLFEKRLIHQDYGEGTWADYAKEVVMDAQHEPNRIYNYAFEGEGTDIDNEWFRGWKYSPGEDALKYFPDWQPNHLYSMYDTCTYDAKFWEAKESAFISGEEFSESNWTLLGVQDDETGDVEGAYGVYREDEEDAGPDGTALGGWGGTSSCHISAKAHTINNGGGITSISMANSTISTSLVAPIAKDSGAPTLPDDYTELEYIENPYGKTSATDVAAAIDTGINVKEYSARLKVEIDAQQLSGVDTSIHRVIFGAAHGDTSGTWNWAPQYTLAMSGGDKYDIEVPTSTTPGSGNTWVTSSITSDYKRHIYGADTTVVGSQTISIDGTVVASGTNTLAAAPDCTCAILCRKYRTATSTYPQWGYSFPARLYGAKIWAINDRLVRNFIPCKRNADDVAGVYDLVNGKFYASASSHAFTAGPEKTYTRTTDQIIHTRFMTYDIDVKNPGVRLFLEGYGGSPRLYSPYLNSGDGEKSAWKAVEYDFPTPGFDVYRYGIELSAQQILADTPLCYIKPVEGDEWDLGVRVGEFPTEEEQTEAGWLSNRVCSTYEWKNAKETLLDLSNMDSDNFWYTIDENYNFNFYINQGSDTVNVALSYPKNITSMTVATDADNVYNYIKGDGSADVSQDPLVSGVTNSNGAPFTWIGSDSDSMAKYWALAEAISYDSEYTLEALKNDIATEISTASLMQDVPTIKISNNAVTPDQIGLGDMVSVEAIDVPYVQSVNGLYKINSYSIDVDADGNESLSLTLTVPTQNQINTLSFPQLIKMMLNRLKGVR